MKLRDWSQVRRGWSQRTPKTLLDALANMDVNSASSTAAEAEQGEEAAGRRQWAEDPPNTLLNALAQAELTSSTVDSVTADSEPEKDGAEEERKKEKEESDMEMDEDRLEPRSDDDDTNFEESEDELREAVADSMRNLFVMEDGSSEEAERTQETADDDDDGDGDGVNETEVGREVNAKDSRQTQREVEDSRADVAPVEPEECDGQSDHATLNKLQHPT